MVPPVVLALGAELAPVGAELPEVTRSWDDQELSAHQT